MIGADRGDRPDIPLGMSSGIPPGISSDIPPDIPQAVLLSREFLAAVCASGEPSGEGDAPDVRREVYLDDLRAVMAMPGGSGLRVLRRWLDEAEAFTALCLPAPRIYAATALADYARERMAEAAVADPVGYLRIHLAGMRRCAGQNTPNSDEEVS